VSARVVAAFGAGLVFGLGLIVSGTANPAKIISFLDIAGAWDPSLLVVMAAALAITAIGYRAALTRARPLFDEAFRLPEKTAIDRPLLIGAAVFGAGWGMSGLCPGPAIVGAATLNAAVLAFVGAMLAGMLAHDARKARCPPA
jgi:uncharacterized membrane protein YedE/YeeE